MISLSFVRRHLSLLWIVALSGLGLTAGCYKDPDINKIVCGPPNDECPAGYACRILANGDGRCCRTDDLLCGAAPMDGAAIDVSSSSPEARPNEVSSSSPEARPNEAGPRLDALAPIDHAPVFDSADDGPSASLRDVADTAADAADAPLPPPDLPADSVEIKDVALTRDAALTPDTRPADVAPVLKAAGDPCTTAQECSGGNCVDGHCCGTASCPACQACTGANGTCQAAPSSNGQGCGTNQYCNNGTCGACTLNASCSTGNDCENGVISCTSGLPVCTKASNKSAGTACGAAQTCTGGAMTPAGSCNSSGTCTAGTPQPCGNGCSGNACAPLKSLGATCSNGTECSSGNCVNGHCCGSSSCPSCQACTGSNGTCATASGSNGQACPTANQYCYNGACNPCTPGNACNTGNACENGQTSCSTGTSVCVKSGNKPAGTSCGTGQTCTGSTKKLADACNSSGTCVSGSTSPCVLGCAGNDCVALLPDDYTCSASNQCASGYCTGTPPSGACSASACGTAPGQGCCVDVNQRCTGSGLVCFSGMCVRCGMTGYSCCSGNTCPTSGSCNTDTGNCE